MVVFGKPRFRFRRWYTASCSFENFVKAGNSEKMAGEVVVDALPYFDQGYEETGVRDAVSILCLCNSHCSKTLVDCCVNRYLGPIFMKT